MAAISYLDRFLEPMTQAFTPELARRIMDLRADAVMQTRVNELRRKANEGNLTPQEQREYQDYVEAVDVISIIQAKARRYLADRSH